MKTVSLLYHDVINNGKFDLSGNPGIAAARYKLDVDEFERHLQTIEKSLDGNPVTVYDLLSRKKIKFPFLLTFDDGGASACTYIADALERFGWYGHFFITVNYIGTRSFVNEDQIRELRRRGHVVGTHSCSHPERMSHCSWDELVEEWDTSLNILSNILDEQVTVGSIPGGYYSKKVARAASFVGIKALFTSQPSVKCHDVNGCLVLGRYMVLRGRSPEIIAGITLGRLSTRLQQLLFWNLKKIPKNLGGEFYVKMRKFVLEHF